MNTITINTYISVRRIIFAAVISIVMYLSVFAFSAEAAAPVVQSLTPTSFASSTTSHNVNIPAVSTGDVLLVLLGFDVNYSITTPSGWTQLFTVANGGWSSMAAYYKIVPGDASSTTVDFVSSSATTMGAQVYRITGANSVSAGTSVVYGSLVNQPNPPSLSPGWGVIDTLWIAAANQNQSSSITSVPANYTNGTTTSGAVGGIIHSARRTTTASSEDPGVWTFSGSWESIANTIALAQTNTAPSITSGPSAATTVDCATCTRVGPNNRWQFLLNATDSEQTGSNQLTYYIHTQANRTGTQVNSSTFTQNNQVAMTLNYNASGLIAGSNTLYVSVYDGTAYSGTNPSFTLLRDDVAPTASTNISTTPSPVSGNYTVTFTPNDATSTSSNEMSYQIRTAAAGGGTLLTSGTANSTSGTPKTTGSITTDTLSQGSNTRYVRTCDGANNCTDTSFTVTGAVPPTSVTTVAYDPPALYSFKNTLKGSANPNSSPANGYFRLYTSAPDCTQNTGGTRVPASAGSDPVLGSGSSPVSFSYTTVAPLTRQTNYWYCAYAYNVAGGGSANAATPVAAGYQTFTTPDGPAGGCDAPTTGDITISDNCTFPGSDYDGVDAGGSGTGNTARITLSSGGNITIQAGQKIARGSITFSGGTMTLANGNGGVIRGGIYLKDADGDGYIDDNTTRYIGTNPPAGFVRRNYLATTTYSGANYDYASKMYAVSTYDCNTASNIESNNVNNLATDADQDGYYTGATGTACVGGTTTVSGRTYYRVADGTYSKIIGNPTGGVNAIGGSDCYDTTGEPCKPTISSVGSPTQTSLVVTFAAGAGPSASGSALLWCDRTANGTCSPNIRIAGSVTSPYTHNATITCGKTYAYKVTNQNTNGDSDFSDVVTGATSSCASAPSVTTSAASSVGATTAVLNSTINPNGASTNVIYRYGTSNVACSSLPSTLNGPNGLTGSSPLSGGTTQNTLTGLTVNTTYYFCATASNGIGGQQYGSVTSFTTVYLFYDTFTGTNGTLLTAHAPDTGTSWTKLIDVGSGGLNINTNTLKPSGAVNSAGELYTTNTISTADQRIQVTMTTGNSGDDYNLLVGRAADANNMYAGEFNNSQSRLYKRVAGTWSQIGQTGVGIADGSIVVLNIKGTNIELLDDGVLVAAVTDSSLSAAGSAGVGMGGIANSTGDLNTQVLDNFMVSDGTTCVNWYRDADGDTYGITSPTAACGTAGYVGNARDCYDGSSNAKPGQASYFTSTRGGAADGAGNTGASYDYDCNGTDDKQYAQTCTSTYTVQTGSAVCGTLQDTTFCNVSSPGPACGASTAVVTSSYSCGDGVESSCFNSCNYSAPGGQQKCR